MSDTGHVCDPIACGVTWDPLCPAWGTPTAIPFDADTVARLVASLRSPNYGPVLRAALLELVAPDVGRIVGAILEDQ